MTTQHTKCERTDTRDDKLRGLLAGVRDTLTVAANNPVSSGGPAGLIKIMHAQAKRLDDAILAEPAALPVGPSWDESFRHDAREYADKLRHAAPEGTVWAGVVDLLDHIALLPDPYAAPLAAEAIDKIVDLVRDHDEGGFDYDELSAKIRTLLATPPTPEQPAWCEIHQHYKWCQHNGGVMGKHGWTTPAEQPAQRGEDRILVVDDGPSIVDAVREHMARNPVLTPTVPDGNFLAIEAGGCAPEVYVQREHGD